MGREIREDEILLGTTFDAYEQDIKRMLSAPIDRHGTGEGRSKWQWLLLANGELCLVTFPLGEMYEEMTQVRNVCKDITGDFIQVEHRVAQEIANDFKQLTCDNIPKWVIRSKTRRWEPFDEPMFLNSDGTYVTIDTLHINAFYSDYAKGILTCPDDCEWVLHHELWPDDYRESIGGTKAEWIVQSRLNSTSGPLFFSYENEMWFSVASRDELNGKHGQLTDKDVFTESTWTKAKVPWGGKWVTLMEAYGAIDHWTHRRRISDEIL